MAYASCVSRGNHYACKRDKRLAISGVSSASVEKSQIDIYTYPPSNSTTVSIILEKSEKVSLKAFDMIGKLIATIADSEFKEGRHEIPWDTRDLNPGIYLLRAQSVESTQTIKLVVLN
jgi:hypothetical protein